jgi:hypothetical protein
MNSDSILHRQDPVCAGKILARGIWYGRVKASARIQPPSRLEPVCDKQANAVILAASAQQRVKGVRRSFPESVQL